MVAGSNPAGTYHFPVPGTGVRFRTPEARVDVGSNELTLLRDELKKIAATNPPRPEVTSLIELLRQHDGPLGLGARSFEPDEAESALLLRATDHLRKFDHRGFLMELRHHLATGEAVREVEYRLRFVDARPAEEFTSYSHAYQPGDRLVTVTGDELYVIETDEQTNPHELLVDDWRAGANRRHPPGFWST
jgi:hypothetical protein